MKNKLFSRSLLRLLALLAALMLLPLPVLAEGTGADVEDVDLPELIGPAEPREHLLPIDFSTGPAPKASGFSESKDENKNPVRKYEDSTISVTVSQFKYYGPEGKWGYTDIWYADIVISDPSQLRTASISKTSMDFTKTDADKFANGFDRTKAVIAMNGDSWCASEKKGYGVVVRQGQLIQSMTKMDESGKWAMDLLVIDGDGDFQGIHAAKAGDYDLDNPTVYKGKQVLNVFSFGPILVENGEQVYDFQGTDRERSAGGTWLKMRTDLRSQRAVLCQMGPLHYRIYTCAGERSGNRGLTLPEMAELLAAQGVQFAYNMDGGESSVLYLQGYGKVNMRSTGVRNLWDLIYFASAEQ